MLANSFLAILFSGISSSYKHRKLGSFHPKEIISIAIPAMVVGSTLSYLITSMEWYKEIYFKSVFLGVLLITLWRLWKSQVKEAGIVHEEYPFSQIRYLIIGVATGLISAFSGLGGGVAMIPLLTLIMHMDIKKASGISIGVIPIMILPFLVVYGIQQPEIQFQGGLGYLQFLIVLPVAVGIFVGSPMGVALAKRLESRRLNAIFAALLVIIAVKYGYQLFEAIVQ